MQKNLIEEDFKRAAGKLFMSLEIKSSIFAKMALYKTASMEIASTKNRNTYTTNLRLNEKIHKNTKK